MASLHLPTLLTIFTSLIILHGSAEKIIYEDGYSVKTIVDGNKLKINPHSVGPLPGSPLHLLLLDSSNSLFYKLSFPLTQESVPEKFAGNGMTGYSDGDASSAMFDKPRSFAVDFKGNVYVADRSNFAVRKISRSGTITTIAGGYSKAPGRTDGPGRNATFSTDYELTFVPEICALLIVDHGHKLIRQINLKHDDCGSSKSAGLGVTAVWIVALVVSCVIGLITGFFVCPYIMPRDGFSLPRVSKSWTFCQMNLEIQTLTHYFGTRNAVASPTLIFLRRLLTLVVSHVSLMFRFRIKKVESSSTIVHKDSVSLLDDDKPSSLGSVVSQKYADQLRDLLTFNGDLGSSSMDDNILKQENGVGEGVDNPRQIDDLMLANLTNLTADASNSTVVEGTFLGVSSVVKRR